MGQAREVMSWPITVRLATLEDLPAIDEVYNHYVRTSTCTYQIAPGTAVERAAWLDEHGPCHPATVAVAGDELWGFGSLSPFRARDGYRHTVENSVYVRHDRQRRGVGRLLLADLVTRARALGHHAIIAGISADQPASLALHQAHGFVEVARLAEVGRKFERWLDVVYLQLLL